MAFKGPHSPESRAKMARSHTDLHHSPETCLKISQARREQPPPNYKDGRSSKKAKQEELEYNSAKRLSGVLQLSENQIQPFLNSIPEFKLNQTDLNLNIFLNHILSINRKSWSSFSILKKQEETGDHPLKWFQLAQEDIGLNLDFSLSEIKRKQDQIVKEHCRSLKGNNPLKKKEHVEQVKTLEKLFCDVARARNTDEGVHLLSSCGSVIRNRNYKLLLKLQVVLDALGLKKDIDKRQYIKGVFWQKFKKDGCKFIPIKTLASPLCILDFLFYLKKNWYERHAYSGDNKDHIRELEYGLDYYEERASLTCGFVADMVHTCRTSRLRSEITSLNDREECVWWIMQSPVLKPFRKLISKARPDIHKQAIKTKKEAKSDDRLKEIMKRIRLDGEERWRRSGFPMFGDVETDKKALDYAFRGKPKICREAILIYKELRCQV